MKNLFLSTTALVAGSMLLTVNGAQAAEKIKLGLGGYFAAVAVAGSQSDGVGQSAANTRNHGFARESEIFFRGETTLDNGISFGVDMQLEGETSADQIDESYIYVQGTFGRVVYGQDDPASDSMYYGSPAPIEGVGLVSPDFVSSVLANGVASPAVKSNISGDADKITYFTPRMSGFQFGLSYTPDTCGAVAAACASDAVGLESQIDTGQQSEAFEGAVNYVRAFKGGEIALYAGMATANVEGTAAAVAAAGAEDQDQWGVGFTLVYGDITFGADYREDNQGTSAANTDRTDYSVGVNYVVGDWTVGMAYAHGEAEAGAGLGKDETDGYQVGAYYALGPGITLTGGMTYWDVDDNLSAAAVENEAKEFVIGTVLEF
jgi:predicted porin